MWYGKQASPASSTSTIDQQEILLDPTPTTAKRPSTTARQTKRQKTANQNGLPPKRPKLYNLPQQLTPWKSLQHHFLRHTDVKFREKRMTMNELNSEVLRRRDGWKVFHLTGQLTDLLDNEVRTRERIRSLLDLFVEDGAKKVHDLANNCHKLPEQYAALLQSQRSYGKNEFKPELIVTKLDDLLKGDLQRSIMFDDHLRDCRDLIVRITSEHRDRVAKITTKFNKRIQL